MWKPQEWSREFVERYKEGISFLWDYKYAVRPNMPIMICHYNRSYHAKKIGLPACPNKSLYWCVGFDLSYCEDHATVGWKDTVEAHFRYIRHVDFLCKKLPWLLPPSPKR